MHFEGGRNFLNITQDLWVRTGQGRADVTDNKVNITPVFNSLINKQYWSEGSMVVSHIWTKHAVYCSQKTLKDAKKSYKSHNLDKLVRLKDVMQNTAYQQILAGIPLWKESLTHIEYQVISPQLSHP